MGFDNQCYSYSRHKRTTMAEKDYSISSLVDFDEFFVIPKIFYKSLGMAPYKDKSNVSRKTKLEIFLFASAFLNINFVLFCEIVDMSSATILQLTAILCCFAFTLLAQFKISIIWKNKNNVNSIIGLMKQQFPKTAKDQSDFDVGNSLMHMLRLEKLYIVVLLCGVWSFNLMSLAWSTVEYLVDPSNEFVMRLPYYKWYPFKVDNMWIYFGAYFQQVHVGLMATNCFLSADIFLFSVISVLLMNFRYVQRQLENLVLLGTDEDMVKLKKIMNFHQMTLNMANLANSVFSTTLLLNFISSIILIGLAAFQTTAPDVPVIQLVTFIMFLLHELVQTGAICYLGQKLIDYVSSCLT